MLGYDRLPEIEEDVRELCKEIVEDDMRASYISLGFAHMTLEDEYPDDGKAEFRQSLGLVLRDAEYVEEWSSKTYRIKEDEL